MNEKLQVVVLGSNYMTRLSLIRSICEAVDCEVTVVEMLLNAARKSDSMPVDCYSKYVKRHLYGIKFQDEALCELLLRECAVNGQKPFLLSVDDDSACLIDKNYDRLKPHFICANIHGEQGQIAHLMNKQVQKELAKQFGFHVAKSWVIENRDGKYLAPADITFPCFIKGLMSYHTMKAQQGRYDSREDLEKSLERLSPKFNFPIIAEEFLDIEKDMGVIGFCNGKEAIVPGVVELLESGHGSHHGVSVIGRVRNEQEGECITSIVAKFVSSLGLNGLFNVDLVVSKGKLYFVELNLRFAAYGYAVTKAGVNLPELYIKESLGMPSTTTVEHHLNDCYYLNERIALDDVIGGYRTLSEFKQLRKMVDFGLMDAPDDHKPYRIMVRRAMVKYVKSKIKGILRR